MQKVVPGSTIIVPVPDHPEMRRGTLKTVLIQGIAETPPDKANPRSLKTVAANSANKS